MSQKIAKLTIRTIKNLQELLWNKNTVAWSVDVIPTFFTVLSLVFLYKKKTLWGAAFLGIAAAYKTYPLFLIRAVFTAARARARCSWGSAPCS